MRELSNRREACQGPEHACPDLGVYMAYLGATRSLIGVPACATAVFPVPGPTTSRTGSKSFSVGRVVVVLAAGKMGAALAVALLSRGRGGRRRRRPARTGRGRPGPRRVRPASPGCPAPAAPR